MIQRIQTLYLLLAGLLPAFTFFIPIADFKNAQGWVSMDSFSYDVANISAMAGSHPWGVAVLTICALVLAWKALFTYKNRKKQLRWVWAALACHVAWYATFLTYAFSVADRVGLSLQLGLGSLLPLLSMASLWMARRAIRHDEELIKATDRIR